MKEIKICLPIEVKEFNSLRVGDKVLINGLIYTARDKAHQLLANMIAKNHPLPINLNNAIIYYSGPIVNKNNKSLFDSAGPTTSNRMDQLTLPLLEVGVKGFIGKGPRSSEVIDQLRFHKAIYFSAVGGAGALLAERIVNAEIIAFPDLGTEAVYGIEVTDFPCYVTVDIKGNYLIDDR